VKTGEWKLREYTNRKSKSVGDICQNNERWWPKCWLYYV